VPIVKFNMEGEFAEELEKDAALVERRIVRLTNLFRTSSISPNIRDVLVLATYSVQGQVVRLERYCGDVWGINDQEDNKVLERAAKAQEMVKEACERLGLELRAGSLED